MTTDTVPKEVVVHGAGFTVGGMAKGAAMLAPDMATMLAVLTTDAQVDPGHLRAILRDAVTHSFNELIVDGATSHQRHGDPAGQRPGRPRRPRRRRRRGRPRRAPTWPGRWRPTPRAPPAPPPSWSKGRPAREDARPGGPQGGRQPAGAVLAVRCRPLLGPDRQRAGLGRRRARPRPGGDRLRRDRGVRRRRRHRPRRRRRRRPHGRSSRVDRRRPGPGRARGVGACSPTSARGYIDENKGTS